MVPALAIIILALTWLGRETEWLRLQLLVGAPALSAPDTPEVRAAWDTFDWRTMQFFTYSYGSGVVWKVPLCGWDWITGREHIIPEYDVEFSAAGCRYKMHLNSTDKAAKALGQVMKVNTKKHLPNPLPKLTYKGNKPKRIRKTAARASVNCA